MARAFWLNFVSLYVLLNAIEFFLFPPYIHDELLVAIAFGVHAVIVKLIVFGWQVVGVLRTCARKIRDDMGRLWAMGAQLLVAGSLVITCVLWLDSYHDLQLYRERQAYLRLQPEEPGYRLELLRGGTLIHLRGPLEIGITARLEDMLGNRVGVTGIILDSDGGQIYEGRGLARLISEYGLRTYSLEKCYSSCTTAFVAGTERALGADARLGFHQYRTHSVIPSINVLDEQRRDMQIFLAQGVSRAFLEEAFSHSPDSMWRPSVERLQAAGVIHRSDFVLGE